MALAAGFGAAQAPQAIDLLDPAADELWKERQLARRTTDYRFAEEGGRRVLRADSRSAASAYWRRVEADGTLAAAIEWEWRIERTLATDDSERTRSGDDFAARLMVSFSADPFARDAHVIAYVWARALEPGSEFDNPHRRNVRTIVLRGGDGPVGEWVAEHRNLAADYLDTFGGPARPVRSVAFVVDTDNTSTAARSWLAALRLLPRER